MRLDHFGRCVNGALAGRNTWNISCGIITNETALGYSHGKPMVLDDLYKHLDQLVLCSSTQWTWYTWVLSHHYDLQRRSKVASILLGMSMSKCMTSFDGDCTSVQSLCSQKQIAAFLLAVEKGAILACDGWDKDFSKSLGDPLGPAVKNGNQLVHHFKSGTYMWRGISQTTTPRLFRVTPLLTNNQWLAA